MKLSWMLAPYRWRFGAVVAEDMHAVEFDANRVRTLMAEDPELGSALTARYLSVVAERLHAARHRLIELYAYPERVKGRIMLIAGSVKRWMYRGDRPNWLAKGLNRLSAVHYGSGVLASSGWVTLEVTGRRSGHIVACPLAVTTHDHHRYLVSMLGERANWVANVRAAHGDVVLRHGRREPVHLTEVPVADRPPILRCFLSVAPGARPHIPVDRRAPIEDFERVAANYPVFLVSAAVRA